MYKLKGTDKINFVIYFLEIEKSNIGELRENSKLQMRFAFELTSPLIHRSDAPTAELLEALPRARSKFNNIISATATIEDCIGNLLKIDHPPLNKVGTGNFGKTHNSGY